MGPPPFMIFFFVLVVVFMIGSALVKLVSGASEWADNNSQPAETREATLVSKRTEVTGGEHSTHTQYYATFELPGGQRQEFKLDGSIYGQLAERDTGQLTYQGTRYLAFQRGAAFETEPLPAP